MAKHSLTFVVNSFYPMFPPASGDNLNLLQMPHIQMDITPDILILPSRLKSFAKVKKETYTFALAFQCTISY
jgi:hypothetical protein